MATSEISSAHGNLRERAPHGVANALFRQVAWIAGEWVAADSGAVLEVRNPATNERLGVIPNMGAAETQRAIDAAVVAQATWARSTTHQRAEPLHRWASLMGQHREALARLMTHEQGKPLAESRGEIDYARGFLTWFAEEAKRQ